MHFGSVSGAASIQLNWWIVERSLSWLCLKSFHLFSNPSIIASLCLPAKQPDISPQQFPYLASECFFFSSRQFLKKRTPSHTFKLTYCTAFKRCNQWKAWMSLNKFFDSIDQRVGAWRKSIGRRWLGYKSDTGGIEVTSGQAVRYYNPMCNTTTSNTNTIPPPTPHYQHNLFISWTLEV